MSNTGHGLVGNGFRDNVGQISVGLTYPSEIQATYQLKHIAVHTPSEHTFRDPSGATRKMPLELQLFHQGGLPDGLGDGVAVVAIGFDVAVAAAASSSFLDALRNGGLPQSAGLQTKVNEALPYTLDFAHLFGDTVAAATFWQYNGSLTTPPCDSGVTWFVRDSVLHASGEAISDFDSVVSATQNLHHSTAGVGNARMFQPINGRNVVQLTSEDVSHSRFAAPQPDTGFQEAVKKTAAAQRAADDSLGIASTNSKGAAGTAAAAGGVETLVTQTAYQICGTNLARAEEDLLSAEKRQHNVCAVVDAARVAVNQTMDATARQQAQAVLYQREALCTTMTKNVQGLQKSAEALMTECAHLAPKISQTFSGGR
jgi:carbonic anhydrase